MLCGAIQNGELAFELEHDVDTRIRNAVEQMRRRNPNPDLIVTRAALKEFAACHGYNPEFLRD
jgi:hypothetical protein